MADVLRRNNVQFNGKGKQVILLAHGFGCDQNAWKYLTPYLKDYYSLVLFDYVGAGNSDLSQYDAEKYSTLDGYAADIIDICAELKLNDVIFVAHSVSCMIGLLASIRNPSVFSQLIFIGPSPHYINTVDYTGGFDEEAITSLLEVMEEDYISWARSLAPSIMDPHNDPGLGQELADSFCYIDPVIAKQFAKVTFLSDNRTDLPRIPVQSLSILCEHDMISPTVVGKYIEQHTPGNELVVIKGYGHCPHMSHPAETAKAIRSFIK